MRGFTPMAPTLNLKLTSTLTAAEKKPTYNRPVVDVTLPTDACSITNWCAPASLGGIANTPGMIPPSAIWKPTLASIAAASGVRSSRPRHQNFAMPPASLGGPWLYFDDRSHARSAATAANRSRVPQRSR